MHVSQLFRNRSRGRHENAGNPASMPLSKPENESKRSTNKNVSLTHSHSHSHSLKLKLKFTPQNSLSLSHNFRFEFLFLLPQLNLERFQSSTMLLHHHHPLLYDSNPTKASLIASVMSNNTSRSCIGPSHVSEMRSIIVFMHLIFFFLYI